MPARTWPASEVHLSAPLTDGLGVFVLPSAVPSEQRLGIPHNTVTSSARAPPTVRSSRVITKDDSSFCRVYLRREGGGEEGGMEREEREQKRCRQRDSKGE